MQRTYFIQDDALYIEFDTETKLITITQPASHEDEGVTLTLIPSVAGGLMQTLQVINKEFFEPKDAPPLS